MRAPVAGTGLLWTSNPPLLGETGGLSGSRPNPSSERYLRLGSAAGLAAYGEFRFALRR